MLYRWKILDVGMVLFALGLLCFQLVKKKKNLPIRKRLIISDYVILFLAVLYVIAWLRNTEYLANFVKVESAFLVYFLGRVYGEAIFSYGRVLAGVGYGVVYANFVYRFIQFGCKFTVGVGEEGLLNSGGFYYYKTDLAVALLLAAVFIFFFSKCRILKWITVFPVVGYMIFYSGARMEMAVLLVLYLMMILYTVLKRTKRPFYFSSTSIKILTGAILLFTGLTFVVIQFLPFENFSFSVYNEKGELTILEKIFHSRHVIWWNVLHFFRDQSFLTRSFGIDLGSEYLHSVVGDRAHSLYVKQLYATGYWGCLSLAFFVTRLIHNIGITMNRKSAYVVCCLWMIFLLVGISIESMEYTQMSWFPMIFAGALFSMKNKSDNQSS